MHFVNLLNALLLFLGSSAASQVGNLAIQGFTPAAFEAPSANINVTTFLPLTRRVKKSDQTSLLTGVTPAYADAGEQSWYTAVTIGHKTFNLEIDTGSSDTWVVNKIYQCFDINTNATIPQSSCNFAPGYSPGGEFKVIPDENFLITYGDGTTIDGIFGHVTVKIGGLSVKQQVAVANHAGLGYVNDGLTSGVLGLAYPALVAAYSGTDINNDTPENQVVYNPIFTSMWKAGIIPPVFSLAISRPPSDPSLPDGYLAFGGLPPVGGTGPYGSTPLQYVTVATWYIPGSLPPPQKGKFYVITPDEFLFEGSRSITYTPIHWAPLPTNSTTAIQVIVDAGSTLNWLPAPIASTLASLFSPPAIWNETLCGYSVPCTAIGPHFAVRIGGVIFPIDPRDMMTDDGTGQGTCMSSVAPQDGEYTYILGDAFLKNVIAVFDVGYSELRFRSRGHY